MPRQRFDSSSSESSTSLPKRDFIASDNKKHGIPLKRKQPSISNSSESDSENEQRNIKEKQQNRLKQMKKERENITNLERQPQPSLSTESDSENEQQNTKGKQQQSRLLKQTKIEFSTPIKQPNIISHKASVQPEKNIKSNAESKKKQIKNKKMVHIENHAEIDDQDERASSSNSINAPHVTPLPKPKDMYNFFKFVIDLNNDNKICLDGKKANVSLESLLKDQPDLDPAIDLTVMQNVFNNVYRWATLQSETHLVFALNRVMEYIQTESILQRYTDCPKPHKIWNIFVAKFGKTPFNAGEILKQKFKNKEDIDVKLAEEEYNKNMEKYTAQLHEYLDRYKDYFFDSQIDYIQKNIKKLEKSYGKQKQKAENGKGKAKASRNKGAKKMKKETPFELWKMTKEELYPNSPEKQRDAKLLKIFNKLNEAEKSVYEKLAEGLNKKQSNSS